MGKPDLETQIEILTRAIEALVNVRQVLAARDVLSLGLLDNGMTRAHLAECLCFDLKHTKGAA